MPSIFPNFSKFFAISVRLAISEKILQPYWSDFFEGSVHEGKKLRLSGMLSEIEKGQIY
jgi:hypothetical protein